MMIAWRLLDHILMTCLPPVQRARPGRFPCANGLSWSYVTQVVSVPGDDVESGPIKLEAQTSDDPKAHWVSALLAAVVMGLVFGSVMDLGKVTNPIVIRQQFIFQRFIMLKMFLGAAGSSAFCFALLSKLSPRRFHVARQQPHRTEIPTLSCSCP